MSFDDLFQEGAKALIRAAELYDANHESNSSFLTYAMSSIYSSLVRESLRSRMIRIPDHQHLYMFNENKSDKFTKQAKKMFETAFKSFNVRKHDFGEDHAARDSDAIVALEIAMKKIPPKDRIILEKKYGLNNQKEETDRQMAAAVGITHQGVHHRVRAARARLKEEIMAAMTQ